MRVALVLIAALSTACASTGAVPRPFPSPDRTAAPAPAASAAPDAAARSRPFDEYALVGTALSLRGVPYRNGGSDPTGFDCSGFTQYVFGQHGVQLPREVREQFSAGTRIDPPDVQPGDLLFFSIGGGSATHVGIAIGSDEFIHAPSSTGVVRVERVGSSYWAPRFVGARRIS
jgi:cell wall-associated NlpC family hydrolase